ncbi:LytTR family DNA-binding domain-containing protein [Butyrivibrio sp. DSM 10294]|uniref:LytR/AlgR family response regulator transcription factor n=1 Tax=Butyrivibrio sp. DSM 10294 TaxID=2972457 RepID=UPI00234F45B4|nr:LytTR family DNA-binding domain-containing protein [Butyrivibrio sp. DSM 10294]MDC7293052.1 LytTR family DNA-binding domain-containing protein [Butyrivibrio sp. DSM 10294]
MMIKVMIVEDEEQIRGILKKMIERTSDCSVVASCGNFASAISEFIKIRPDVVFMDIDLAGESGLDCAKAITEVDPKVKIIFATAHSEYMANAFEIYAFDYLVKPFDLERITKTLERIKAQGDVKETENSDSKSEQSYEKLVIRGKEEINLIDTKDIIMVERADGMCRIVTKDEVFLTATSLTAIQEKLDPSQFMRCHKSYIIRLSAVRKLEVYGRWTYTVTLKDTSETALMTSEKYNEMKQNLLF